jgi:hypothetical protein
VVLETPTEPHILPQLDVSTELSSYPVDSVLDEFCLKFNDELRRLRWVKETLSGEQTLIFNRVAVLYFSPEQCVPRLQSSFEARRGCIGFAVTLRCFVLRVVPLLWKFRWGFLFRLSWSAVTIPDQTAECFPNRPSEFAVFHAAGSVRNSWCDARSAKSADACKPGRRRPVGNRFVQTSD